MKYKFRCKYAIYEKTPTHKVREILFNEGEIVEIECNTVYSSEDRMLSTVMVSKEIDGKKELVAIPITVLMFCAEEIK